MNATVFMRQGGYTNVLDVHGGPAVQISQEGSHLTLYFEDDPEDGMTLHAFMDTIDKQYEAMKRGKR